MKRLLRALERAVAPPSLEAADLAIGADVLTVEFRRHANARRLVLRLNPARTGVMVTVPKGVSRARALDFVRRSRDWIASQIRARGEIIELKPGHRLPLRGEDHEIRHLPSRRGTVTVDPVARVLLVPGELPHVPRRLQDWLKLTAKAELTAASRKYAAAMGVSYRRISIRDQRSRWGSCSAQGDLSYSWRLILTPSYVLDYVAAHEVAHLRHLDHSTRFWRLVLSHCPHAARAKAWLKSHGQDVHRVIG